MVNGRRLFIVFITNSDKTRRQLSQSTRAKTNFGRVISPWIEASVVVCVPTSTPPSRGPSVRVPLTLDGAGRLAHPVPASVHLAPSDLPRSRAKRVYRAARRPPPTVSPSWPSVNFYFRGASSIYAQVGAIRQEGWLEEPFWGLYAVYPYS